MIITVGADGTLIKTIPDRVYQGSNNADTIAIIGPIAQSATMKIAFKLPQSNEYTRPYLMTPSSGIETQIGVSAWTFIVPIAITEKYGTVMAQFFATTGENIQIASGQFTFEVERGVEQVLPAPTEPVSQQIYEDIYNAIQQIRADIINGWLESKAVLPYDSTFEYSENALVYDNKKFYKSLIAKNKDNALDNTAAWEDQTIATLNEIQTLIAEHNAGEASHPYILGLVAQNTTDISYLFQHMAQPEEYIGQLNGETLPTDEELNAYVEQVAGRAPKNSDVVIFILQITGQTDKNYKYIYSVDGWNYYEIPPMEVAENGSLGIVKGNYGTEFNGNTQVDIVSGEIKNIFVKDNASANRNIREYLNVNDEKLTKILNGQTIVPNAQKAIQDQNGNVIDTTYAKADNVYTKNESDNKFLPSTYTNIYYYSNQGIIDTVPTTPADGIQFQKTVSTVGTTNLFDLTRILSATYNFTKNSTDSSTIWVMSNVNTSVEFKLTTAGKPASGDETIMSVELTGEIALVANQPRALTIGAIYSMLGENKLKLENGDTLRKSFDIITTDINVNRVITIYSSSVYPSTFNLVAQSIVYDLNLINGLKQINILSSEWIEQADGTYQVAIPQSRHGQPVGIDYILDLQASISATEVERIVFSAKINNTGTVTLTAYEALDCTLLIGSGRDTAQKGILAIASVEDMPDTIDYNVVGTLVITNEGTIILGGKHILPVPANTSIGYNVYIANTSQNPTVVDLDEDRNIQIAAGDTVNVTWAGKWLQIDGVIKTNDIFDDVNNRPLDQTLTQINNQLASKVDANFVYEHAGYETQVDYNAILEDNKIKATFDTTISDLQLYNSTGYLVHIYLPLTTLTGELDDTYTFELRDKDGNIININTIYQEDINENASVGNMCQVQEYDVGIGYSWTFYAHYKELAENNTTVRLFVTDTIIRETNTSMSGQALYTAINNSKLAPNTTVLCTNDYTSNGTTFVKGHNYKIVGDYTSGELLLSWEDITPALGGSLVKTETYDNTTFADHISEILGYTNNENGGTLLKIGFKLGATAITGTRKNVSINTSTGAVSVTEGSGTIMNANEFVYMTPGALRSGATSGKKVTFICANDTDLHSNSNIDISNIDGTNSVTISGQEFGYMPNSIDTIYYVNVDIMNVTLEHLTIDHYVV